MEYNQVNEQNEVFAQQKCGTHKDTPFTFFCFTCKKFICNLCFKDHQKHELEIKEDLEETSEFAIKLPKIKKEEIQQKYKNYKEYLLKFKAEIENEIALTDSNLNSLSRKNFNLNKGSFITDYSYEDYQNMSFLQGIENKISYFNSKINSITQKFSFNRYKNFRWMSNEINIILASSYKANNQPDIILGKVSGDYYLSDGNKNHFLVFDFGKKMFINKVKISTANFECIIKNFIVSIKNAKGEFEQVGKYLYMIPEEFKNNVFQEFNICAEGRILKLTLIDNWGPGGGNFILIKRMLFECADIIEF